MRSKLKNYINLILDYGYSGLYLFLIDILRYIKVMSVETFYERQHKCIEDWLKKHGYVDILLDSSYIPSNEALNMLLSRGGEDDKKPPVWVCWLQGEDNMPVIVKKCLETIRMHSNGHQVNLITIDNYFKYIDIDPRILKNTMKKFYSRQYWLI